MIRINQLKLPIDHTEEALKSKAAKQLKLRPDQIRELKIVKRSVDARKKEELLYIYTVDIETDSEAAVLHRLKSPNIHKAEENAYRLPKPGTEPLKYPPVVIGSGPAGLFCALMLARAGYRPIVLERGEAVEERIRTVGRFWAGGPLDPGSNVQFGEGGAGTFSDGKLNTLVKDPLMRNHKVLELLTEFGADPSILYLNKPHIGTDVLSGIVKNIRQEILRLGGQVRFRSQVTGFGIEDGRLISITVNGQETIPVTLAVLAIGHSARDTFETLLRSGVPMESKAFAVGLRIQHPQSMINRSQYGVEHHPILGAADYKLTHKAADGRGVYTFCMCPGGYVVNASSEPGHLAVNGMSDHARDGQNANSAVIVTVTPEDYQAGASAGSPLSGVAFQRKLEEAACHIASGSIPLQLYGDFKAGTKTSAFGSIEAACKGSTAFVDLRALLPSPIIRDLIEGIDAFGRKIQGFDRPDAVLAGVESRTSSPVRIPRGDTFESSVSGLYPCGEGAGYAGGITSAAMDGLRVFEAIMSRYSIAAS